MAGGLFGRAFVFNEKCIVFSILCMMLFLYKPVFKNNYMLYFTLFVIFVVAYVAMAWYDYYFNCDLVSLRRGKYSITGILTPPTSSPEVKDGDAALEKINHDRRMYLIYAIHLICHTRYYG